MNKLQHEPGEPTPEELTRQFTEALNHLKITREMFLVKQHMSDITPSQAEDMFQRFETEQIEFILADLEGKMNIPWKAHPDTVADNSSDLEASADTFIDVVGKEVTRYEITEAEGTSQIEIAMTYRINNLGKIERIITTENEELPDHLEDIIHPAFTPLLLPGGDKANVSSSHDEESVVELDLQQARQFVNMISEVVAKLGQVYRQTGWEIMLDTDRTPDNIDSSSPEAVFKIERLELD
jgi:hypothetical protein